MIEKLNVCERELLGHRCSLKIPQVSKLDSSFYFGKSKTCYPYNKTNHVKLQRYFFFSASRKIKIFYKLLMISKLDTRELLFLQHCCSLKNLKSACKCTKFLHYTVMKDILVLNFAEFLQSDSEYQLNNTVL